MELNPLNQINLVTIAIVIAVFAITHFVLRRTFFLPVIEVMERRRERLEAAAAVREQAADLVRAAEADAATIRERASQRASRVQQALRDRAQGVRAEKLEAAREDNAAVLEKGREAIAADREAELAKLRADSRRVRVPRVREAARRRRPTDRRQCGRPAGRPTRPLRGGGPGGQELLREAADEITGDPVKFVIELVQFGILLFIVKAVAFGMGGKPGMLTNMLSERRERVRAQLEDAVERERGARRAQGDRRGAPEERAHRGAPSSSPTPAGCAEEERQAILAAVETELDRDCASRARRSSRRSAPRCSGACRSSWSTS